MYLLTALRAFFRVLFNKVLATDVARVLDGESSALAEKPATEAAAPVTLSKPKAAQKPVATRSEALTLLAALQREGRLVDFLREDLGGATDAQIGAVARDLQRDCRAAVERFFALAPLSEQSEGSRIELPAGYDAARYHVLGKSGSNTGGSPAAGKVDCEPQSDGLEAAVCGVVLHPGWRATKCDVPTYTGPESGHLVIAPCEVERK
jgi:hypothetical protein